MDSPDYLTPLLREKVERLSVLNLTYDVTPAECVTSVVCESGLVAPSDVPSLLR